MLWFLQSSLWAVHIARCCCPLRLGCCLCSAWCCLGATAQGTGCHQRWMCCMVPWGGGCPQFAHSIAGNIAPAWSPPQTHVSNGFQNNYCSQLPRWLLLWHRLCHQQSTEQSSTWSCHLAALFPLHYFPLLIYQEITTYSDSDVLRSWRWLSWDTTTHFSLLIFY